MNYDQKGHSGEQDRVSAEAKLFEEILNRLDAKQGATDPTYGSSQAANQPKTIDLIELFYYCLSKCYIVIIGALLGAVLMGLSAKYLSQPFYTATSKLYIVGQTGLNIITDLQIGTVLTLDYQEVFKTWEVHQMVNEELGIEYPYSVLQSMVSVTNPEDTRVLYITSRHPDAQMAADIANAYAVAAKRFITETMLTDEPTTFSIALVPSVAIGKSMTTEIIKGFLLGTVLACWCSRSCWITARSRRRTSWPVPASRRWRSSRSVWITPKSAEKLRRERNPRNTDGRRENDEPDSDHEFPEARLRLQRGDEHPVYQLVLLRRQHPLCADYQPP